MSDDEQALLQAVYDQPSDDAPRLVYADWLLERGDPRGEFIMLQCSSGAGDAESPRVLELRATHGKQWLGVLAPCLETAHFRRGFPSRVRVDWPSATRPWQIGAPAWSTVESLTFLGPTGGADGQRLLVDPAMKALHEVRGLESELLLWLAQHDPPLPFRALHAQLYDGEPMLHRSKDAGGLDLAPAFLAALSDAHGLPHLERLYLWFVLRGDGPEPPAYLRPLLETALVARLDVLELAGCKSTLGASIAAAQLAGGGPRTLRLHPDSDTTWDCDLTLGSDGRRSSLRVRRTQDAYNAVEPALESLMVYLDTVDAALLSTLTIDLRGEAISDDHERNLRTHTARFSAATMVP